MLSVSFVLKFLGDALITWMSVFSGFQMNASLSKTGEILINKYFLIKTGFEKIIKFLKFNNKWYLTSAKQHPKRGEFSTSGKKEY